MGRTPLPSTIKKTRGGTKTYQTPVNELEPIGTEFAEIPAPPDELGEHAKKFWIMNIPLLMSSKILTTLDSQAFITLCEHYQVYKQAQVSIENEGITYVTENKKGELRQYANPNVQIMRDYGRMVDKMLGEFGLNPSARSKVKAQIKPGAGNGKNKKDNKNYNNMRKKIIELED